MDISCDCSVDLSFMELDMKVHKCENKLSETRETMLILQNEKGEFATTDIMLANNAGAACFSANLRWAYTFTPGQLDNVLQRVTERGVKNIMVREIEIVKTITLKGEVS